MNVFQTLERYLLRIGVEFEVVEPNMAIEFTVEAPEGKWDCLVSVFSNEGFGFYSSLQEPVPSTQRSDMALYLTALNNQRLFGNFELDLDTGQLRFKTYVNCDEVDLTEGMIDRSMLSNVTTMQRYLPQLLEVMRAA